MAGLGITLAFHSSRKWVDYYRRIQGAFSQEEKDNGIDRLPDDILCNIVSRLKPIEASRTSILSRRWRKIWTMNHRLKFYCLDTVDVLKDYYHDNVDYGDRQRFLKAVNQCLRLYSDCKLKVFTMHCCFLSGHTCHLVRWMQALSRLDVVELYLGNSCDTCDGYPPERAFTFSFKLIDGFSKLKHSHLRSCYVETNFVSQCNSLVTLILSDIPLLSHKVSDILVSCPNLGSLCMERCELPLNLRISGQNIKLTVFKLIDCYNMQKLEISDLNVMTIKIDTCSEVELFLSSVPKLGILHLGTPGMNYRFGDVPRYMPQINYLLVQTPYQLLRFPSTFQVFRNVKILILMTRGYLYPDYYEVLDLWNFAQVLCVCPLLEHFFLVVDGPVCKKERRAQWPVLRHEHLVEMDLSGFSNTQNELDFAKFILTSAQVLEELNLWLSWRNYYGERFCFEEREDLKQIDAQAAQVLCANLQRYAFSSSAISKQKI